MSPESVYQIDWDDWKPDIKAVLCFLINRRMAPEEVLLIERLSDYGRGIISAPGGKLEPGETFEECVVRECEEEVGLRPKNFALRAELFFHCTDGVKTYCHTYIGAEWEGEPRPSPEARPFWCRRDKIPLKRMWEDDPIWLPYVLDGGRITGRFLFDKDFQMLSHQILWDP